MVLTPSGDRRPAIGVEDVEGNPGADGTVSPGVPGVGEGAGPSPGVGPGTVEAGGAALGGDGGAGGAGGATPMLGRVGGLIRG